MGGQPKNVTQTNKVELGPEQKEIFGLAKPFIQQYAASTPQIYPDSGIADFNPSEVAGQQAALAAVPGLQANTGALAGAQNLLLDPGFMLNPNQYLAPAADAVRHQGEQVLESGLRDVRNQTTTAGGQYSSGTRGGIATGVATGKVAQSVGDAVAKMYLDNYTKGLSTMADATKNNSSVLQQLLFPSQVMSGVGAQQRSMEQAKLDEAISKFYTAQDLPLLQAKELVGLAQGFDPSGATSTGTVKPGGTIAQPWQQALGLGLTFLGGGMGIPGMGLGMGAK